MAATRPVVKSSADRVRMLLASSQPHLAGRGERLGRFFAEAAE